MGSYGCTHERIRFRVFHEERVRVVLSSSFQTFQNLQNKISTGTSSDEVEAVMFDSRILESPVHIVVFIESSEATRRISTSSSWTAARTART